MDAGIRTTLVASLFFALFGVACAGELDPRFNQATGTAGTGGQLPFCDAPNMIFTTRCGFSGCHGATGQNAGLDLSDPTMDAAHLVGQGPTAGGASGSMCESAAKPYIQSGTNPATGLLLDKLTGMPCGSMMPVGLPLEANELDCVRKWATNVANQ